MNRNDFGTWGLALSREEFAQALAALGVIVGEGLSVSPLNGIPPGVEEYCVNMILDLIKQNQPLRWSLESDKFSAGFNEKTLPPVDILVHIWRSIIKEYGEALADIGTPYFDVYRPPIRLEIYYQGTADILSVADAFWFIEQLSLPEVAASSVFVWKQDDTAKVVWDYPLRIGFLKDPRSEQLISDIAGLKFYEQPLTGNHIEIVEINGRKSDCEILLLPHDVREAVVALIGSPNSLRADCVIITGRIDESLERLSPLMESIRTQARAASVCLAPVRPSKKEDSQELDGRQIWFKELIRGISHNYSFDTALFRACRMVNTQSTPAKIFSCSEFTEKAQLIKRVEKFQNQIVNMARDKVESETHYPWIKEMRNSALEMHGASMDKMRTSAIKELNESVNETGEYRWNHESETATHYTKAKNAHAEARESAPPLPPKPRWVQTEIWEYDGNKPTRNMKDAPGLQQAMNYSVEVYIGQKSEDTISADIEFNIESLPKNENEHELNVFFTEPNVSPEPKKAKITLPREGDSTRCKFFIQIPTNITQIQARIIIAYKNRILQTVILIAPATGNSGEFADKNAEQKIETLVESVPRPGMTELTGRTFFDAAFILNHDNSGKRQLTKIVNDDAELISVDGLEQTTKWFDDTISEVAEKWKKFEELDSKNTVNLLRECAISGVDLYKGIMAGRDEQKLMDEGRIQLITAKYGARLPAEFIYDRCAPDDDAKLCPHVKQALLDGHCDKTCVVDPDAPDAAKIVCPMGFWGISKVIERHAYDAGVLKEMLGADFALQSDPGNGRTRLNILNNAVTAFSDNVDAIDNGASKKVLDALNIATKHQFDNVDSWADWVNRVKQDSPSLLLLLPHMVEDLPKRPILEIGGGEHLKFAKLRKEYVLGPTGSPPPVVILMGCKTGAPETPYESFILEFRNQGAALVVGTGSTILGRHAATVVVEFIEAIASGTFHDMSFGDLMRQVRRKMVAQGILMALCLTSYGDTDWKV